MHIADVTHFVRPNSMTDLEAKARSTTVYLADRRYDMLPEVLSSDLCSLISGVDRCVLTSDFARNDFLRANIHISFSSFNFYRQVCGQCYVGAGCSLQRAESLVRKNSYSITL